MPTTRSFTATSEEETRAIGALLATELKVGDTVSLDGELGAGKTTLIRGLLRALGHAEPVRSPTFGLIQLFETNPPVMHADLYRVQSHKGIGIEEYLHTHLCLIEWPDRAEGLVPPETAWLVTIQFDGDGRTITVTKP